MASRLRTLLVALLAACNPSSRGEPDAPLVFASCDGTSNLISPGSVMATDTDRVFLWNEGVVWTWPKAGGLVTPFARQDLGRVVIVGGDRYYWGSSADDHMLTVTDAAGATLGTVTLPEKIVEWVATDDGIYVETVSCAPECSPSSLYWVRVDAEDSPAWI